MFLSNGWIKGYERNFFVIYIYICVYSRDFSKYEIIDTEEQIKEMDVVWNSNYKKKRK